MNTLDQTKLSAVFYQVVKNKSPLEDLIKEVKTDKNPPAQKYAYQAFCCAMLAKQSKSYLQKGKYIKQYAEFLTKSLMIDGQGIEARLIRLMIERKLENVKFTSHAEEDTVFLKDQLAGVTDENLKELIQNVTENE